MSELDKTQPAKESAGGKRRRRRRSRPRKRHDSPQGSTTGAKESAGSLSTPKPGPRKPKGHKENVSRETSRGQRRGRHPQSKANSSHNRRRRPSQPRRNYQSHRIETVDETSAGGLVISGLSEAVRDDGTVALDQVYVALIGRLDRRGRLLWSMPKGHVEPDEDIRATAEREVWEETGLVAEVFADLGVIDYWFVSEGKRIHKTVHHHLLRYVDGELNDQDPEVTEVAWVPASQLIEHFAYADERKLARVAAELIPEMARKEKAEGRQTPR